MNILGLESASQVASVAIYKGQGIAATQVNNLAMTHSETLLPMVDAACKYTGLEIKDMDGIAVSVGPGSFTGLRIGIALAKGLSMAYETPIIPVPTLDALAYGHMGSSDLIVPLMDARRSEAYTGFYFFEGTELKKIETPLALPILEIVKRADDYGKQYGKRILYTGDGLGVFEEVIKENAKTDFIFAPEHLRLQNAASLCVLGKKLLESGIKETGETLAPLYLRMSQAEQERLTRGLLVHPAQEIITYKQDVTSKTENE